MIDAEKMKASWLEAVVNGEAEGFARHWMPDILDELSRRPSSPVPASPEVEEDCPCKTNAPGDCPEHEGL